jgi:hypothetical protein
MSILKTLIEKRGLWDNIHAKRKRIKAGSGEKMRKPGSKGAPTDADFKAANEETEQIDELKKSTVKSYMNKKVDQINKDTDLQYPFKPKPISKKEAGKNAENLMRGHARISGVKPTSEEVDVKDTDDYKLSKDGKKMKAHKIVFNKGEEENKKGVSEQMKKSYKDFVEEHTPVEEELKGNQHKLDKNKNGKLDKHDFKLLRKEDAEQVDEAESHQSKTTMKHVSNPTPGEKEAAKRIKPGIKGVADRIAMLKSAQARGGLKEEEAVDESAFDWKGKPSKLAPDSSKTKTAHDVKTISTGTVYTKQRDADGMSKEFKRDPEEAKRGRGRPKKNKFAEAVEFLINLDEETFDSFMEEGFDSFMEEFEQLDELSKTTLGSYARKAAASAVSHTAKAQHSTAQAQDARNRAKDPKLAFARSGNQAIDKIQSKNAVKSNVKAGKRLFGVNRALSRLTK